MNHEQLQLENDVLMMSSAKGEKDKKNENKLILNTTDNVRLLFQNLQDKVHDFANSERISKMNKTRFDIKKENKNLFNN